MNASPAAFAGRFLAAGRPLHLLINNAGISTGLQAHPSREELLSLIWADSGGTLVPGPHWKTIEQGSATIIWATLAPELDGIGRRYLQHCAITRPRTQGGDPPNERSACARHGEIVGMHHYR